MIRWRHRRRLGSIMEGSSLPRRSNMGRMTEVYPYMSIRGSCPSILGVQYIAIAVFVSGHTWLMST